MRHLLLAPEAPASAPARKTAHGEPVICMGNPKSHPLNLGGYCAHGVMPLEELPTEPVTAQTLFTPSTQFEPQISPSSRPRPSHAASTTPSAKEPHARAHEQQGLRGPVAM